MARYIDADLLIKNIANIEDLRTLSTKTIGEAISKAPTADVVEVKHGEWMPFEGEEPYGDESETTWYKCSICGTDAIGRCYDDEWYSYPIRTDYCPKCGADLRTPKERGGEK